MTTFTTNLELGQKAFVVRGSLDYYVEVVTVGQVRVCRTLPKARSWDDDPIYKEEYMCIETGVGSGNLWEYGKNIFKNQADAEAAVIKHQQRAYKERAKREARRAEYEERKKKDDLRTLQELKAKYETV